MTDEGLVPSGVFDLVGEKNLCTWLVAQEDGIEGQELKVLCFDNKADLSVVEALSGRVDGQSYLDNRLILLTVTDRAVTAALAAKIICDKQQASEMQE